MRLRTGEFDRLCNAKGLKTARQRCEKLGISPAQLAKVRGHQSQPGPKFIHAAQAALEAPYAVLFEIGDRAAGGEHPTTGRASILGRIRNSRSHR